MFQMRKEDKIGLNMGKKLIWISVEGMPKDIDYVKEIVGKSSLAKKYNVIVAPQNIFLISRKDLKDVLKKLIGD